MKMITVHHVDYDECLKIDPTEELYRDLIFLPKEAHVINGLKKGAYKKVAEVDSIDLEEAFHLTNSIESHWSENDGVTQFGDRNRSTSVGDIAVLEDKVYMVAGIGFKELPKEANQYVVKEKTQKRFNI